MNQLSLSPREVTEKIVELGKVKIEKKFSHLMLQGIMAGLFIGFGGIAFTNVFSLVQDRGVGLFLASSIFPIGIFAILLLGFELYTGNTMTLVGVFNKDYGIGKTTKMLTIVWIANLIGSLLAVFLAKGSNVFTEHMVVVISNIGEAKADLTFAEMFLRGLICNILVCAGVLMALTAKDNISKMAAVYLPIVVFILARAEHIVANMFFMPMAYLCGADITILDIIYNFIFVTLGNLIGGAFVIGGVSYLTQLKE